MASVTMEDGMEDLRLAQMGEVCCAQAELEDMELAFKMQLYEALVASSQLAAQKGIPADIDDHTKRALDLEVSTQGQKEALQHQAEEIERARQESVSATIASTAEKDAAAQYRRERSDARFARYLADLSDDEWEDYGDTYDIRSLPREEREFADQVQLRCVGISSENRAGGGAVLIGSNNQALLELSPQLQGPHTACSAELEVIIQGLKAARAFGLHAPKLVLSPFVLLKLCRSVEPLDASEADALDAVRSLIAELGADVKEVPLSRNKRALRLARNSIAKYTHGEGLVGPRDSTMDVDTPSSSSTSQQEPCPICLESRPHSAMFSLSHCRHRFCTECVSQHAAVRVRARALPVPCPHPGCTAELSRGDCESLLPPDVFGLLLDVQAENCIPGEERVYCPYKDCSAMMSLGDWAQAEMPSSSSHPHRTAVGQVECVNCHRLFCLECQVPWHLRMSCREYQDLPLDQRAVEDVKLHNLAAEKEWKQCPSCRRMIELAEGCNHMTCVCGTEFCYLCAALWRGGRATCECPLFDDVEEENEEQVRVDYEAERRRRLAMAYKTRLCVHYARGYCRHGDWCRFAHGQHELRYPEENME